MRIQRSLRLVLLALVFASVAVNCDPTLDVAQARSAASAATPAPATRPVEGSWIWPVASPHPVTRPFDVTGPYAAGHRGVDLGVAPGAAVVAPAPGVVRFAGFVVDRPVLSLAHDDGSISSFEPVDAAVTQGTRVTAGQLIGTLSTSVVHVPSGGLHLGARIDGTYVNPLWLLGALQPAVLLPLGDMARP